MKLVFDTNVLLSGLTFGGRIQQLLLLCLEEHEVFISPPIWRELVEILAGKFALADAARREVLAQLQATTKTVEPATLPVPACRDPR